MSYFSDHYSDLKYPLEAPRSAGFRPAQLAALQAVGAHFFSSDRPAIITMPTGSGKTALLLALPFLLRATRVLILTPSRLVREQITENFGALVDLKKLGALSLDVPAPRVFSTRHTIGSEDAWEDLREFDVVVATVPSVSPREGAIPPPPDDLFDLVLVDEAHHAPALTWNVLLQLLRNAKQILFTATPFRRDEKEIQGRLIFTYHLKRARDDGVFGDINFESVPRPADGHIDIAIAQAAARRFAADRAAGYRHLLMVRVDSIARCKELLEIYTDNTPLRLAFVNGAHSLKHVKTIIKQLDDDELDGIVCVNMFGEGFNMPRLKIAAVHSPHKSLAITLQFIGRFARVADRGVGQATFLAEPITSNTEIRELYESGAEWREIVQNLAGGRIESEAEAREIIDSFDIQAVPEMDDFSMYTLKPYLHVKIFRVADPIDLRTEPDFSERRNIIFRGISEPKGAAVYITREAQPAQWSTDERFTNVKYDIFVFHHNPEAGLLFICASRRQEKLYDRLIRSLVSGRPRPLSHNAVSRVLNNLEGAEFFNVGMRKRHLLGRVESYRMIAGPSADKAVRRTDARSFDLGHVFGKGLEDGEATTIGISPRSKVWSTAYERIPEIIEWCDKIAEKVQSGRSDLTGSNIDFLSSGEELREFNEPVIAMVWGPQIYKDSPFVSYNIAAESYHPQLTDFDTQVERTDRDAIYFCLRNHQIEWHGVMRLVGDDLFSAVDAVQPAIYVNISDEDVEMAEFLNEYQPSFYTVSLSRIEGENIYRVPNNPIIFDNNNCEAIDWVAAGVNITKEKPDGDGRSIFEWLEARLIASQPTIIFCDDGTGEIADFIAVYDRGQTIDVHFYHCKASEGAAPGNRVADLYEVCGQAIKSSIWVSAELLLMQLEHRDTLDSVRGYIVGNQALLRNVFRPERNQQIHFYMYLVQPGIHRENRTAALSNLLAATGDQLSDLEYFGIISSQ